jgi:hypothetical protein
LALLGAVACAATPSWNGANSERKFDARLSA